jgi:hypothetical protein
MLLHTTLFCFSYVIESNGLPDYAMEQSNRNTAVAQNYKFTFDKQIEFACTPGNLNRGTIGITKTGVAIFSPTTSAGVNAGNSLFCFN